MLNSAKVQTISLSVLHSNFSYVVLLYKDFIFQASLLSDSPTPLIYVIENEDKSGGYKKRNKGHGKS